MDVAQELRKIVASNDEINQRPVRSLIPYIITQKDLISQDIPPREYILGQWMPKDSFGMIYAPRGLGKSWFCMALAVSIAKGNKIFLGWELHDKHSVLYVDGEMAKVELKERFSELSSSPLDNLFILSSEMLYKDGCPISLDVPNEQKAVNDLLDDLESKGNRAQVIILDNLSTLRRGINENDNNEAQALLDWLISLRHKGYTVIVVHHSGKNGSQRGASIIEVPMDYVIKLSEPDKKTIRSHDGAHFEFSFDKVRGRKPKPYKGLLSLRTNSDGVLQLCSDQSDNIVDRHYVLLKIFGEFGSLTHREVCKKLDISIGSVNNDLKKLRDEKLLENRKDKKILTREGERWLFELWPQKFPEPHQELDFVQTEDQPF